VDGRDAPSEVVLVHDVVVDQRERLDHLDRDCGAHHVDGVAVEGRELAEVRAQRVGAGHRLRGQRRHRRTEPLSAGFEDVPRRLVEPLRVLYRQLLVDSGVDELTPLADGLQHPRLLRLARHSASWITLPFCVTCTSRPSFVPCEVARSTYGERPFSVWWAGMRCWGWSASSIS